MLKQKYNRNICDTDVDFNQTRQLSILLAVGFGGGWVAGALGLGGGSIFVPALVTMRVPPKVAAATSLYLITFSKVVSCCVYFLNGELIMGWALWLSMWATLFTILGMYGTRWCKLSQSSSVYFLAFILWLSAILTPIIAYFQLRDLALQGHDILKFSPICAH